MERFHSIPSKLASMVMNSLVKKAKVIWGWLGVSVQDLTSDLARDFGAPKVLGALVGEVVKGSPADKAGIKKGDIIESSNGKPVPDSAELRNLTALSPIGSRVALGIIRDKKRITVDVTIGEMPKMPPTTPQPQEGG